MLADGESQLGEPATDWWRLPISIFGLMASSPLYTIVTVAFLKKLPGDAASFKVALETQVTRLREKLETSSLSHEEALSMIEILEENGHLFDVHLSGLVKLVNERIGIGMPKPSVAALLQNYEKLPKYIAQDKWKEWCKGRDGEEDETTPNDILQSMLNHIRLLGGRHLAEKSLRLVCVVWLLCYMGKDKAIRLNVNEKSKKLTRLKRKRD